MKIAPFFKEYLRLINDEHAKLEIQELALEYNLRFSLLKHTPESTRELTKEFLDKTRRIAAPSVTDKVAYEKLVWRQNNQLNSPTP